MAEGIYSKFVVCPVCSTKIEVTKTKIEASKLIERETDFCVRYEGLNPILYDIWVCGNCGYAAQSDKFENVKMEERQKIIDTISSRWKPREFTSERNAETALEAYKLALYVSQVIDAKPSDKAKLCHRIAWIYREKEDEKENEFLRHALKHYCEAFEQETFPINKLDEHTCMYLIGEINRRLGNLSDAKLWFSRIISSQGARQNRKLMEMVREQNALTREAEEQVEE